MSLRIYFPHLQGTRCASLQISNDHLEVMLVPTTKRAQCPLCHRFSHYVHSRYWRTWRDLPWSGCPVTLRVQARRFFCRSPHCHRRIFTERFPTLVEPKARSTVPLRRAWFQIGLSVGGQAGSRLATALAMPVSPRTLLRLLQTGPVPEPEMPRVVGIDDFAWKKGRQYGTILVDLEQRQVVDLLPDRSADSVAAWLSCRPHVDLVCRDRSGLYADGARRGAPQAQQVADRFHLLTNLVDTLEELLLHQRGLLKEAAAATLEALAPPVVSPPDEMYRGRRKCPQNWQRRTEETSRLRHVTRLAQYEAICALRAKGMRLTDIAQQVGVSRQTVDRYLRLSGPPERKQPIPTRRRVLEPFEPYLLERWQEGCHNGVQLWREIRARGYPASVANVARFVRRLRQEGLPRKVGSSSLASRRGPSARQVAFLLVRCPLERTNEQRLYLEHLTQRDATIATASTLTERFAQMVRERQGAELDRWIAQATQSGIAALQRFAQGLQSDYAAVKAGLTEIWSNGQTEGQINRLKLLKRQSYGRAGFALLRQRVLSAA